MSNLTVHTPGELTAYLQKATLSIKNALPKHLTPDRMIRLAVTCFSTSPKLRECSAQSILGSLITASQLGLEPGVQGQGYLIPYKGTCTFVPGWKGLVELVARAGRATVWTGAVCPGDEFDYQLGDSPFCRHKPGDGAGDEPFTHVYAIGRVKDASMPVIEVWTRKKVQNHLARYNKIADKHYAMKDENNFEMYARKVALLQVLKYMPASIELQNATQVASLDLGGKAARVEEGIVIEMDEEEPKSSGDVSFAPLTESNPAVPPQVELQEACESEGIAPLALAEWAKDKGILPAAAKFPDAFGKFATPIAQAILNRWDEVRAAGIQG